MGTALITGSTGRVPAVASALKTVGFEALTLDALDAGASSILPERSINCYVQLPASSDPTGSQGSPVAHSLVARVDAVAAVTPLLARDAAVLLVAEDTGWDWRQRGALRLLVEAAVAGHAAGPPKVVVLDEESSPADIAAVAGHWSIPPLSAAKTSAGAPSLADLDPDLSYADWRNEVLSLAGATERNYFGWVGDDGRPRVAVLSGAVVSPLRVAGRDAGSVSHLEWGPSPSAHLLARALLGDTLGAEARCLACAGVWSGCSTCKGSGLATSVLDLADLFADEIVRHLPPQGFELRVADVANWVHHRGLLGRATG